MLFEIGCLLSQFRLCKDKSLHNLNKLCNSHPVRLDIINNLISTLMDFLVTFAPADGRKNYIIGRFPDLETSIDLALALHRSSNVAHFISVIGPERSLDTANVSPRLVLEFDGSRILKPISGRE